MGINFPASPVVGDLYPVPPQAGVPQYKWDGTVWVATVQDPLTYVKRTGDVMSGALVLPGNPVAALDAAPKQYVDGLVGTAQKVNILTPHENLVISRTSTTVVQVNADAVALFTTTGTSKRFTTLSKALNITVNGANGRDGFTEGPNVWYYIWAIGKADGTLDTLLSPVGSVTPPGGYDYKGLLGAVYNDGSSNFINFFQRGIFVIRAGLLVVNGGTAASFTVVSLSAGVPPAATQVIFEGAVTPVSATTVVSGIVASEGAGTTVTYGGVYIGGVNLASPDSLSSHAAEVLSTPQQIKYYAAGSTLVYVTVKGWVF